MGNVFVSGASGYVGRPLSAELIRRGHTVRGLVRRGSEGRLAAGCQPVFGNALDAGSFSDLIAPADTFVQLVGVAHPGPSKAAEFRSIDLASARAGVTAAARAGVSHFVYMSVAHPAPVMHAYIAARSEAEEAIRESGIPATILRPWYVVGRGHWWPLALVPAYWIAERIPSMRESARRLGLVTLRQMVAALADAVDAPPIGEWIVEVPEIRRARSIQQGRRTSPSRTLLP